MIHPNGIDAILFITNDLGENLADFFGDHAIGVLPVMLFIPVEIHALELGKFDEWIADRYDISFPPA